MLILEIVANRNKPEPAVRECMASHTDVCMARLPK
jgi:hypothetical protein